MDDGTKFFLKQRGIKKPSKQDLQQHTPKKKMENVPYKENVKRPTKPKTKTKKEILQEQKQQYESINPTGTYEFDEGYPLPGTVTKTVVGKKYKDTKDFLAPFHPEQKFKVDKKGKLVPYWSTHQEGIEQTKSSPGFKKFIETPKGKAQLETIAKSEYEKKLGPWEISAVALYDYEGAKDVLAEQRAYSSSGFKWESLHPKTKLERSLWESSTEAVTWPVTLSQMGVKLVTGGKTLVLPDVGKKLQDRKITPTSGIVSGGISEVITFGGSEWSEQAKKYPWETGVSTAGELFGLYMGGKAVHVAKTGTIKGLGHFRRFTLKHTGFNLPEYSTFVKYSPKNLLRTGYWKVKEKLGLAEYVPEEQVWDPNVLSGYTKFAEKSGAGKQLNLFLETKKLSSTGDIFGIHASPSRFKSIMRISKGTSETPGLSVSAFGHGSPHFLKITGPSLSYRTSGMSLFPKLHLPTGPIMRLKDVFRIPKSIKPKYVGSAKKIFGKKAFGPAYDISEMNRFIMSQPKGPYGWIAPKSEIGGPEIEAIIRGGTWGKRTSSFYYTSYKGVTVPLPQYSFFGKVPKNIGSSIGSGISSNVRNFLSLSYSGGSPSISILNPGYILSRSFSTGSSKTLSSFGSYKIPSSIKRFSSRGYSRSSSGSSIGSSLSSYMKNVSSIGSKKSSGLSGGSSIPSSLSSSLSSGGSSPSSSVSSSYTDYYIGYKPKMFFKPDINLKGKKGTNISKFLDTKYRYREFKIPSLKKLSGGLL